MRENLCGRKKVPHPELVEGCTAPIPASRSAFARDERGGILPLVGLCLMVILGFAALGIDLSHQSALRAQLAATADAAALAAASELPNEARARDRALEYAAANMPPQAHGSVLVEDDIVFGTWLTDTRAFVAGGPMVDAVQVTVRRSELNGNAAPTFFMRIFGRDHIDLAAEAVAGVVLLEGVPAGEPGEADRARLAEMQEALIEEARRRWIAFGRDPDELMSDEEAVEFLMEEFGKAVLLK
jgi:hypothetical protein